MMNNCLKLGLLVTTATVAGCATMGLPMRHEIAQRLAAPAWMVERQIPAAPFSLTAFERIHEENSAANVYIEGDGLAWLSRRQKSMNPTPKNPIALHLASKDKAGNVIYLARPCQYSGMLAKNTPCDNAYWSGKRYAPEVITSFNKALDEISARYHITGFNLIGFSGGGTVAALLAATRDDVESFRTVAGNLDHKAHSDYHNVSLLKGSMNPPAYAQKLARVPQYHYIGGQDEIVPPAVLHSYLAALGPSSCVKYKMIQEAEHEAGWVDKWPALLKEPLSCRGKMRDIEDFNLDFPVTAPEPYRTTREMPVKP